MRRGRTLVALAAAGLMLLPGTASAAPTVAISGVTVNGGSGAVTGTVSFDPITAAQTVVGTTAVQARGAFTTTEAGKAAGVQLTDATITPISNGLRFTWHVTNLADPVPPEVVRYVWGFQIGTRTYQLIAKRTNMVGVNSTDDPVGYVKQLAEQKNFFSLRGACGPFQGVTSPTQVGYCYHLTFLQGSFNVATKQISIDLPYEAQDAIGRVVMPEFKPGALIQATADGILASLQYGPLQQPAVQTHVQHIITATDTFYTAPQVALGTGAANIEDMSGVTFNTIASISSGTFSGTVNGLTATKNTVYARACYGAQCTYTSFKAL